VRDELAGPATDARPRRLAFVLHAHLPWVLGHGTWPHGEDWLAEAVVHCYLPLVTALERLAARGGRHLLAFSVSPVLAAQLADPRLPPLVEGYFTHRLAAARELAGGHPLASWWERHYESLLAAWRERHGDLLAVLRRLADTGAIELSTCAATHGYLPLLHRREHVALQVRAARHNHRRWFGRDPAGMWMPECAYRPAGAWEHPATGAREPWRDGNESFLAAEGVRWTVVDAHLLLGGEPLLPYSLDGQGEPADLAVEDADAPLARRLQPRRIGDSDLAALVREPHAAQQVWSRHGGYPGDGRYLDFHKRDAASGLRLWRVTDPAGDLGDKLPYHPDEAAATAREHAAHFLGMLAEVPGLGDGVAVCPYDAELFGHWWFEGPQWLEAVLGGTREHTRVTTTTPAREVVQRPPRPAVRLREGSWGEAGDHRVWVNDATAWMWRELREAEERVAAALAAGATAERARALLAQLLLLAASDWPFLVTNGTAADYAAARFRAHAERLRALLAAEEDAALPAWAGEDLAMLTIDPAWWEMEPR
jgi:1,4-alpha-glucan branching enzyme